MSPGAAERRYPACLKGRAGPALTPPAGSLPPQPRPTDRPTDMTPLPLRRPRAANGPPVIGGHKAGDRNSVDATARSGTGKMGGRGKQRGDGERATPGTGRGVRRYSLPDDGQPEANHSGRADVAPTSPRPPPRRPARTAEPGRPAPAADVMAPPPAVPRRRWVRGGGKGRRSVLSGAVPSAKGSGMFRHPPTQTKAAAKPLAAGS